LTKRKAKGALADAFRKAGLHVAPDGTVTNPRAGLHVADVRVNGESIMHAAGGEPASTDGDTPANPGPCAAEASSGRLTPAARTQQSFGFDTSIGQEFLGEEFLLWLWFRWETAGGEFNLPAGRHQWLGPVPRYVGVAIDDVLQFAPSGDDDTVQTLRRGMPTRSAEARTALRQGHRVSHARLLIAEGERQWSVTLRGADMRCTGVKLPVDADGIETDRERTDDRATNWRDLHEIVAGLFGVFVRVRVSESWAKEAAAIADWMAS